MVFGAQKNGGLSGLRTAVRDEGALSERMRLQHIKEERDKEQQNRAKSSLVEKKRMLDRNQIDLSNRETEVRRLNAEITRAQASVKDMEHEIKGHDDRITALKAKYSDLLFEVDQEKKKTEVERGQIDKDNRDLRLYEQEIKSLELKAMREKETIHSVEMDIQKLSVQIAHLSNDASKAQTEVSHASSDRMYKEKELDGRKRSFTMLANKKEAQEHEIKRIQSENIRLEQEIKKLEQEARSPIGHNSY